MSTPPPDFSGFTPQRAADPSTDAATLQQLAQARPDLHEAILANPQCYPGLRQWIERQRPATSTGGPAGTGQAQRPAAKPTAEQWSAAFQQSTGREPTMSEYQAALSRGEIARERLSQDPSVQQLSAGAKQFATGAKDFFSTRVAPAAAGAARSVQNAATGSSAAGHATAGTGNPQRAAGPVPWMQWTRFLIPAAALLAIPCLFLPAVTYSAYVAHISANFFDESTDGEGTILIIGFLLVIAFAVVHVVTGRTWARITTAILSIVMGIVGMVDGFGTMVGVSDIPYASVGAGAVLLGILGLVLIAAGIVMLLPGAASPGMGSGPRAASAPSQGFPAPQAAPTAPHAGGGNAAAPHADPEAPGPDSSADGPSAGADR